MWDRLRAWWPWIKAFLALTIVAGVCWFFVGILRSESLRREDDLRSPAQILWDQAREARIDGLIACMVLYLIGLGCSGLFWILLMRRAEARITLLASFRAYYICHLGKYAPLGKGWALLLRTSLATEAGAKPGIAALTATYETLVTMASGALLACVVLALGPSADASTLWRSLGLLALAGIPILPGVFNRLVEKVAARFGAVGSLPKFGFGTLLTGLAMTACGWACLGASLYAVLYATAPQVEAWDTMLWLRCTAASAVAWVAGYVVSTPGGLEVRELVLQRFLAEPLGARALVVVLMLRLLWTLAELVIAAILYVIPPGERSPHQPQAQARGSVT